MLSGLRKKLSSRWVQTRSFSQCGEDRIAAFILDTLSTPQPTYLDLGANDPCRLNNTFFFYLRGGRGVLVEPDPRLVRRLKARRRRDTIVQAGVGTRTMAADLFLLQPPSLNTFSRSVAELTKPRASTSSRASCPRPSSASMICCAVTLPAAGPTSCRWTSKAWTWKSCTPGTSA